MLARNSRTVAARLTATRAFARQGQAAMSTAWVSEVRSAAAGRAGRGERGKAGVGEEAALPFSPLLPHPLSLAATRSLARSLSALPLSPPPAQQAAGRAALALNCPRSRRVRHIQARAAAPVLVEGGGGERERGRERGGRHGV
jgi:hypothetical protein